MKIPWPNWLGFSESSSQVGPDFGLVCLPLHCPILAKTLLTTFSQPKFQPISICDHWSLWYLVKFPIFYNPQIMPDYPGLPSAGILLYQLRWKFFIHWPSKLHLAYKFAFWLVFRIEPSSILRSFPPLWQSLSKICFFNHFNYCPALIFFGRSIKSLNLLEKTQKILSTGYSRAFELRLKSRVGFGGCIISSVCDALCSRCLNICIFFLTSWVTC